MCVFFCLSDCCKFQELSQALSLQLSASGAAVSGHELKMVPGTMRRTVRQCRAGQGGACRAAAAIVTCMFCVLLSGIIVTTTSASLSDHCPGHSKETPCDMWAETEQIVLGHPKSSSLSKAIKLPYCFVGVQSGLVTCG